MHLIHTLYIKKLYYKLNKPSHIPWDNLSMREKWKTSLWLLLQSTTPSQELLRMLRQVLLFYGRKLWLRHLTVRWCKPHVFVLWLGRGRNSMIPRRSYSAHAHLGHFNVDHRVSRTCLCWCDIDDDVITVKKSNMLYNITPVIPPCWRGTNPPPAKEEISDLQHKPQ